jgi:hypothetical protein
MGPSVENLYFRRATAHLSRRSEAKMEAIYGPVNDRTK